MGWFSYHPIIYFTAGTVALISAYLIWRNENRNPGVDTLALMLVFATMWVFALGLSTISKPIFIKRLWIKLSFIGVAFPGTLAFIAMNQYIHGHQWLTRRKIILLTQIPTLVIYLS